MDDLRGREPPPEGARLLRFVREAGQGLLQGLERGVDGHVRGFINGPVGAKIPIAFQASPETNVLRIEAVWGGPIPTDGSNQLNRGLAPTVEGRFICGPSGQLAYQTPLSGDPQLTWPRKIELAIKSHLAAVRSRYGDFLALRAGVGPEPAPADFEFAGGAVKTKKAKWAWRPSARRSRRASGRGDLGYE